MTPFEQRLAHTPRGEVPAELRMRILAAAQRRRFPFRIPSFAFRIFTWPHPLAWGAVAAAWACIAVLNFSGPRGEALYAVTPKEYRGCLPSPREYLAQMETERRLLAALAAELDLERAREHRPVYILRPQDL